MDVNIFTLCDYAQQDMSGKLTIVGTFDIISVHEVPAIQPVFSIVARIINSKDEVGQHSFKISILRDKSEEVIFTLTGKLDSKIFSDQEWGVGNLVIVMTQFKLPSFGVFSVNLFIDDKKMRSLPLTVRKI